MRLIPLLIFIVFQACATGPTFRAPVAISKNKNVELGLGIAAGADPNVSPLGASTFWARVSLAERLELVGSAHGLLRAPVTNGSVKHQAQAQIGLRYQQELFLETWLAIEGFAGYSQRDVIDGFKGLLDFGVRFPVAQQFKGTPIWVYATPTIGLSIPLAQNNGDAPFARLSECPLGVLYKLNDTLSIYGEGGLWIVAGGGYGALGLSYQF